jgi:mannose-1-phosphate guanylyltransferase
MNLQPVIPRGGSDTRLWPLSHEQYPKQRLALPRIERGYTPCRVAAARITILSLQNSRGLSVPEKSWSLTSPRLVEESTTSG